MLHLTRRAPDGTVKRRAKKDEPRCDGCKHYQGARPPTDTPFGPSAA
jgi:hypothetical protein